MKSCCPFKTFLDSTWHMQALINLAVPWKLKKVGGEVLQRDILQQCISERIYLQKTSLSTLRYSHQRIDRCPEAGAARITPGRSLLRTGRTTIAEHAATLLGQCYRVRELHSCDITASTPDTYLILSVFCRLFHLWSQTHRHFTPRLVLSVGNLAMINDHGISACPFSSCPSDLF